jgi:hypothetical protein
MKDFTEIRTDRYDLMEKVVGLNAGNYIVYHLKGEVSIFTDFTNGVNAVKWLYEKVMGDSYYYDVHGDELDDPVHRLVTDMEKLGHKWALSTQRQLCVSKDALFIPSRKMIRKGKAQPNMLMPTSTTVGGDLSKMLFEQFIHELKAVGFKGFSEQSLYGGAVIKGGNIKTEHPRVVITSAGFFVSHPLCRVCKKDVQDCMMFEHYEKAVDWADNKSISHYDCMSKREQKKFDRLMEEYENYEGFDDLDVGVSCECPMR